MYNILIIEDETAAIHNLSSMLKSILTDKISSIEICESIKQSVKYLHENQSPDLIFMDIHLADGNAFSIFEEIEVKSPIIFTTAYDEYALKAFTVNSIDYLLKPLRENDLERAIRKLESFSHSDKQKYISNVSTMLNNELQEQKTFLIQVKDKIIALSVCDIAFCYTCNELVTAYTNSGEKYNLSFSLELLMKKLNPNDFFRANRQFIISRASINEISVWFGGRLKVASKQKTPEDIVISKLRAPEFKKWLAL